MTKEMPIDPTIFSGSMLETSWAQRSRRSWTTLTSFGLQAVVMGLLLLLPLWRTVSLPSARSLSAPISWGAPAPPAPQIQRPRTTTLVQSNLMDNVLVAPREVPRHVAMIEETTPPPQVSFYGIGTDGSTGPGSRSGIFGAPGDTFPAVAPPPPPAQPTRQFRPSSLLEGSLLHRVQPVYPPLARTARIQGEVVLFAVISRSGSIDNLRVVSGHPMLAPAAVDAVSQWRYRPYILNNEPIEVETQITVKVTLSGN